MFIGFDFETQGFDEKKDAPTEIGLIAFNENFEEIASLNLLIKSPLTKPQPQEIVDITGITDEMIAGGVNESEVAARVHNFIYGAKALFAYNAPFDMRFLEAMLGRHDWSTPKTTVVDVQRDIEYPARFTCKKLTHLAFDHGIVGEAKDAHRAVYDVRLMLKVLAKYDLKTIVANAKEPKVKLRIMTETPWTDKGKSNEFAKANGFHFDPATKHWLKTERQSKVEDLIKNSKWEIKVL